MDAGVHGIPALFIANIPISVEISCEMWVISESFSSQSKEIDPLLCLSFPRNPGECLLMRLV